MNPLVFDELCNEVKRIAQRMQAALISEDWPLLQTLNESLELELKRCVLDDCSGEQKKIWQTVLQGMQSRHQQMLLDCINVKDEAAKALVLVKKQRGAESAYQQIQDSSSNSSSNSNTKPSS